MLEPNLELGDLQITVPAPLSSSRSIHVTLNAPFLPPILSRRCPPASEAVLITFCCTVFVAVHSTLSVVLGLSYYTDTMSYRFALPRLRARPILDPISLGPRGGDLEGCALVKRRQYPLFGAPCSLKCEVRYSVCSPTFKTGKLICEDLE